MDYAQPALNYIQPALNRALNLSTKLWQSEERKWLISFKNPVLVLKDNPTFLMLELVTILWAFLLYKHARRHGGRLYLLFFTSILHGLVVESLSYVLPEIDNFWHGVSSITMFKQRLPLHILLFYPCFHYTSNAAVTRLRLPWWSEPFAVALADLIMDIPFDILGIKFLWWTWHDTDPNIFDRTYSVPLTSYIFHLTFASSFTFILGTSRLMITGSSDKERVPGGYFAEFVCVIMTGFLSMPMAVIFQFIPFYHVLHDLFSVHTEVCVWVLIGLYVMLAWIGERRSNGTDPKSTGQQRSRRSSFFDELSLSVLVHFLFYIILVIYADPASYKSTGPHETVGDCNKISYINTAFGKRLPKKTFLCLTNYTEPYFDFHCLQQNQLPTNGTSFYTICGTSYDNHVEYQVIIISSCLLGLVFFYQCLFKSAGKTVKQKKA